MNEPPNVLGLAHPLMNAAGTVKLVGPALALARSPVAALMLGSYTLNARTGNTGPTYHAGKGFCLNRLGMPNPGVDYLVEVASTVKVALAGRPLFASVAADDLIDCLRTIECVPSCVDYLEVNLGCPNVEGMRIGSFDLDLIDAILARTTRGVGLKLSPYSDPGLLRDVAAIVSGRAVFLTLSNTFPNGWQRGALNGAYGGISGAAMKPIVLGQIRQFAGLLPSMPILAAGGFLRGPDWQDYAAAGACSAQIATRYIAGGEDPDVFVTMLADMA